MATSIARELTKLRTMSRQKLLELWEKLYRKRAPTGIRRELMVPFLAYRMQERAYGGLKSSKRSELRRIARNLGGQPGSKELRMRPTIRQGTRLIRQWRGETHEVVATNSGYEFRGTSYKSLSKIAREITGTRWSGPAFFGLNGTQSVQGRRGD